MMVAVTTIVLVVSASLDREGRKAHSTRGQPFDGKIDGRFLAKRSTTPFCNAARALLAEGVRPQTVFVMRHEGKAHDALRSTVGAAARMSVTDKSGPPAFRCWEADNRSRERSPMRKINSPAVQEPAAEKPTSEPTHTRSAEWAAADALFQPRAAP